MCTRITCLSHVSTCATDLRFGWLSGLCCPDCAVQIVLSTLMAAVYKHVEVLIAGPVGVKHYHMHACTLFL